MLFPKFLLIVSQCIIIFSHPGYIKNTFKTKKLKVDRLDGNCNGKNFPFQGLLQGFKADTKSVTLTNITMVVKEDLMDKIKGILTITRCHSKENLNSCEEYAKLPNFDICQLMNPDGVMGQNILAPSFEPKFKCPYKTGNYYAYNFTTNLTPFLFFNPEGWYWKTVIELFPPTNNRMLGRLCFDWSIIS